MSLSPERQRRVDAVRAAAVAGATVPTVGNPFEANPYDAKSSDPVERLCHSVWFSNRSTALYGPTADAEVH